MHYVSNNPSERHLGTYLIHSEQRVLVYFVKQYNIDELLTKKIQATSHVLYNKFLKYTQKLNVKN